MHYGSSNNHEDLQIAAIITPRPPIYLPGSAEWAGVLIGKRGAETRLSTQ